MNENFKKDLQELVNKYPETKLKDIQKILQESEKTLPKTWEEAYTKYLCNTTIFYIDTNSEIQQFTKPRTENAKFNKNALLSQERAEEMLVFMQLITLRDIYNDGWEPDWKNDSTRKFCLQYNHKIKKITVDWCFNFQTAIVYFKSEKLVEQALEILGEETVKLALGV